MSLATHFQQTKHTTSSNLTYESGVRNGYFNGLSQGALIGNYNGFDLFIDYEGGVDSNDIQLYTLGGTTTEPSPVPEPLTAALSFLSLGTISYATKRRR